MILRKKEFGTKEEKSSKTKDHYITLEILRKKKKEATGGA